MMVVVSLGSDCSFCRKRGVLSGHCFPGAPRGGGSTSERAAGKQTPFAKERAAWRVSAHPEESSSSEGDPQVQEELLQLIRAGVSKERNREILREDVRQIVRNESERLKKATDEAKKDVDKLQQLLRDRSSLEFGSALADINKSADDFEEQLRKSRAEMESRQAEFEAWEQQVARDRNSGQFFQGLYGSVTQAEGTSGQQPQRGRSRLQNQAYNQTGAIQTTGKKQLGSSLRVYLFVFLALNLASLSVADLLTRDPSYVPDGLYFVLAAVLIGTAWSERRLILRSSRK